MPTLLQWVLLPALGALIGWGTNVLAIRMLFRPRQPIRIPLTGWVFQGVVPQRQAELARAIADTVTQEFLPTESLLEKIDFSARKELLAAHVADHLDQRIREVLQRFVPEPLQDLMLSRFMPRLRGAMEREASSALESMAEPLEKMVREEMQIDAMIEEKVMELDLDSLEKLTYKVVGQELRHIELLGAMLGMTIGLVQVLVLTLL